MTPELLQQYIGAIADTLKPTGDMLALLAGKAAELAIRQNYAYAAGDIFVGITLLIAGLIGIKYLRKYAYAEIDCFWEPIWVIGFAMTIIVLIVCPLLLQAALMRLINPEYYAMLDVINVIKGGK